MTTRYGNQKMLNIRWRKMTVFPLFFVSHITFRVLKSGQKMNPYKELGCFEVIGINTFH